jgi:hypothetical protein
MPGCPQAMTCWHVHDSFSLNLHVRQTSTILPNSIVDIHEDSLIWRVGPLYTVEMDCIMLLPYKFGLTVAPSRFHTEHLPTPCHGRLDTA